MRFRLLRVPRGAAGNDGGKVNDGSVAVDFDGVKTQFIGGAGNHARPCSACGMRQDRAVDWFGERVRQIDLTHSVGWRPSLR
jgi:hypothetical protein